MSKLAHLLAQLYPDPGKTRIVLRGIALDPERIDLGGDATSRWERILDEAWKRDKLSALVACVGEDYANRRNELAEGLRMYLDSLSGLVSDDALPA